MSGTVAMAEVAARAGTTALVATPHLRPDHPAVRPHELLERAWEANTVLRRYDLEVLVVPGAELALAAAVELSNEELRAATIGGNGRDLLLETPYGPLPSVFEEVVQGLVARGFRLTLAHPERNPTFQQRPHRLRRLVEDSGALVQLTAGAFTRPRRSRSRSMAVTALTGGFAHALASDAHAATGERVPDMNPGLRAARALVPAAAAELGWMTQAVPLAIVEGRELPPRPPRGRRR